MRFVYGSHTIAYGSYTNRIRLHTVRIRLAHESYMIAYDPRTDAYNSHMDRIRFACDSHRGRIRFVYDAGKMGSAPRDAQTFLIIAESPDPARARPRARRGIAKNQHGCARARGGLPKSSTVARARARGDCQNSAIGQKTRKSTNAVERIA